MKFIAIKKSVSLKLMQLKLINTVEKFWRKKQDFLVYRQFQSFFGSVEFSSFILAKNEFLEKLGFLGGKRKKKFFSFDLYFKCIFKTVLFSYPAKNRKKTEINFQFGFGFKNFFVLNTNYTLFFLHLIYIN